MSLLDLPTAMLMSAGGDDRITLDEQSGLNSYGCAPEPVRAISYSSSTASSISAAAYAHAHAVHHQLRLAVASGESEEAAYTRFLRHARNRIRSIYGLSRDIDIAFAASGTDLEYLALAMALQTGQDVTNIVVEVDEVGSGCFYSQAGQYFAGRTALGKDATVGAFLPGFDPARIGVTTLKSRTPDGPVRGDADYSKMLLNEAKLIIGEGGRPLVHIIHRSKTGIITPSLDAIDQLLERYGDAVDLVVDACQGRISPDSIAAYLERNATIFMTGSKFMGGPPFSAWALVPPALSRRMQAGEAAPAGLADFLARGDMPVSWSTTDSILPDITNFGLLLRIEAGLFEMERLLAMPVERIDAVILAFGSALHNFSGDQPFRLVEGAASDRAAGDFLSKSYKSHPLDRKMLYVIELLIRHSDGRMLTIDEARRVYRLLYSDLGASFPLGADHLAASEICHLGQPVKCLKAANGEWAPTLRLSLSAPQILDLIGLDTESLELRFTADLERIAAKLRLIERNPALLAG
jgi:hypothetical protein